MHSSLHIILAAAALMVLQSCSKDPVYLVPDVVQPYIDDFLAEASQRGLELEIEDLVVVFEEDLVVNGLEAAGVCRRTRRGTPTIKLDTTSINWQSNPSSREQLVFHELGHCVLNRGHIDDRLANGNYLTTMRASGEQLYGAIMSRFKRDYYLDELFGGPETPAPAWSQGIMAYDDIPPSQKSVGYQEDFNDNDGGWSVGTSGATTREITSGAYILTVISPGNFYIANQLDIDEDRDFELEISARVDGDGFAGILWGGTDAGEDIPTFRSVFFDEEVVSIGTMEGGTESSYLYPGYFNEFYDRVTIRRVGGSYYFYVNGLLTDNMDFVGLDGDQFGLAFGGTSGARVLVDQILLSYL